jgi:hypothetical protein
MRTKGRKWYRVVLCGLLGLAMGMGSAAAQSTNTSGIDGKVTDESGAVLPGVTVTISSPALQMPQLTTVTDSQGFYRFAALPTGTYRVAYELSGFQKLTRTGLYVAVGFVATIDVKLKIGQVEESVTVSGEAPVVDVRHSSVNANVTNESLNALPTTRDFEEIAEMAPGSRVSSGVPDVGGNRIASDRGSVQNYGSLNGGQTPMLDGINTDGTSGYFDVGSLQEVQIKSGGNDAQYATAGLIWVGVVKSGGNQFHGEGLIQAETPGLQSNNLDTVLQSEGVTHGTPISRYYDVNASLGGRILPDRLWFFGSVRQQDYKAQVVGFCGGPGTTGYYTPGCDPGYADNTIKNYTGKVTTQLSRTQKLEGFYTWGNKVTPDMAGSALQSHESANNYTLPNYITKGEWTWVPSNQSLVNVYIGQTHWTSLALPYSDQPSAIDISTNRRYGASFNTIGNDISPAGSNSGRQQYDASYTYYKTSFLGGSHEFKVGAEFTREWYDKYENLRGAGTGGAGNEYIEYFNKGLPFEVLLENAPLNSLNNVNNQSAYARDSWRLGERLTLDLGLRWERYHAFLPAQSHPADQYFPAANFPFQDLYRWTAPAPRFGVAYALTEDKRNVLKASYGRYNFKLLASDSVAIRTFNQNDWSAALYRWNDPGCVGPDTGCTFDPSQQGAFVGYQGGKNTVFNPDIQQPKIDEVTVRFERELMKNFQLRFGYIFKRMFDQYQLVNLAAPYSKYDVPVNAVAPNGAPVTYYDLDPALAGPQFQQFSYVNTAGYSDHFNNYEVAAEKRLSNGWQLNAYYLATKRNVWINGVPQTPDAAFYPQDTTWEQTLRFSGSYATRWGINTGAVFTHQSGLAVQSSSVFTTGLKTLGSLTLPLEPVGAERLPGVNLLSLRVDKRFALPKGNLTALFEVYNTLNTNVITGETFLYGAAFHTITSIVPPRVARVGLTYAF